VIVFLSGPYNNGDTARNVHDAIMYADAILKRGHIPFIPHLTHFWHLVSPKLYEFWLEYDLKFLPFCDCVFRMVGYSKGADKEVEAALKLGKTVYYYDIEEIPRGIKEIPYEN